MMNREASGAAVVLLSQEFQYQVHLGESEAVCSN